MISLVSSHQNSGCSILDQLEAFQRKQKHSQKIKWPGGAVLGVPYFNF